MVLAIQAHIMLRGDNPLAATVAAGSHKAYLVANLALNDGPQAAAAHYHLSLAAVHSAMAFYYDNEAAIKKAIDDARELGAQLGARSAKAALEQIKEREA